jgi:hypothetical protein
MIYDQMLHTFPTAKPPTTENATPKTLHMRVFIRTTWGIFIPFKKHFIWGIPLPAATG